MKTLKKYKLGELCRIASSKRIFESEYVEDGVPFVRGLEITDGRLFEPNAKFDCYISHERYQEIKAKYGIPMAGDILITAVGTIGNLAYLPRDIEFYFKDGNLIWFSQFSKRVDSKYLYFFMKSPFFYKQINYSLIGAVQKALTMDLLGKIEIQLPDLSTQKRIADVLSCIDDKIALNNKTNNELENMAKTVYDYWFTQFDFPDANGKPYKASGGKMEYNQVLKREIPAGWEVGKLGDIAIFSSKTTTTNKIENYITTDNILPNKQGVIEAEYIPTYGSVLVYERNDILIANIRPYFKKIWLANKSGMCSNDVLCIKSRQKKFGIFLYRLLWRDDFFDYVMKGAKGSKMPRGDKNHIMEMPIVIPNNSILMQQFELLYNPLQEQIWKNQNENEELTKFRDFLLPLLMNGQIEVR